jgi:hypothetical protein
MCGKNGGDIDLTLAAKRDSKPGKPLVEMSNDCLGSFAGRKL